MSKSLLYKSTGSSTFSLRDVLLGMFYGFVMITCVIFHLVQGRFLKMESLCKRDNNSV